MKQFFTKPTGFLTLGFSLIVTCLGANVDVTDTRPVAVVKPTELHEQKATPSITGTNL